MEKLFTRHGIGLQQYVDETGLDKYAAFTDALLSLNVLIEFYTAVVDDSDDNFEEETVVFAVTFTEECSYSYTLFHSTNIVGPLLLFRIVSDAIKFIEQSEKNNVLEDLKEISTGHLSSLMAEDPEDQKQIYERDVWEFKTVLELINANQ